MMRVMVSGMKTKMEEKSWAKVQETSSVEKRNQPATFLKHNLDHQIRASRVIFFSQQAETDQRFMESTDLYGALL
jgi:hypothetical protein